MHRDGTGTVARLLAGVAVAVALATAWPATPTAGQVVSLRTVRDPANRFTIDVPVTWRIQTSMTKDPTLSARSPTPGGQLPDSIDVILRDTIVPLSPAACVHEAEQVMRFAIHSWTDLAQGPQTIGTLPGYSRVYTWRSSTGDPRRSVQVCVTQGRRAFMLIGTTEDTPPRVSAGMPVLMRIIATFHPNPAAAPSATVRSSEER